jgi:TetR/AcrR family transcriptional regulator, transcriptional repressor for nem operon
MGRVSRKQAAENRAKVVAAASHLFRRKGLDGASIAELMAEAGLTHGGFAGQFSSKEALAGEACAHAFDRVEAALRQIDLGDEDDARRLQPLVEFYLAPKTPGYDCPMATLAGDVAHTPAGGPVRRAFTAGVRRLAAAMAGKRPGDELAILAAMVGAIALRRAIDDAEFSDAIDAAVLRLTADS